MYIACGLVRLESYGAAMAAAYEKSIIQVTAPWFY